MDRNFNDLPLPEEEMAWQKMNQLLDKDEKKRRVLPLLFRSLSGLGILLFVGVTIVWLLVRPEKRVSEIDTKKASSPNKTPQNESRTVNPGKDRGASSKAPTDVRTETLSILKKGGVDVIIKPGGVNEIQRNISHGLARKKHHVDQTRLNESSHEIDQVSMDRKIESHNLIISPSSISGNSAPPTTASPGQQLISTTTYSLRPGINFPESKQTNQLRRQWFVTGGLGMQQQIPIAGQAVVPYSYYGTRGTLPDYLPHIYVQLQKEKKWFVEGDFRFGVAQAVDEFSYSQKTTYDPASMNLTVTTMRLKKTYYHELSSSFNYFLLPNLYVGTGGMYSRFHGAITEQETNTSNVLTLGSKSVKQIIPVKHFTDSFLYKNQWRVLMQVGYQWKKFSFSLRYTKDIQPYIKYTRPDGTVTDEKNQSLQFLLRYKLWQSRRFWSL
jgi:hypothetical protein